MRADLPKNRKIIGKIIQTGIILFLLVLPQLLHPQDLPIPDCLFHTLTGLSCPTCGVTRSFFLTAKGSIGAAMQHHFVGVFLYIGLFLYFCLSILEMIRGQNIRIPLSSVSNKILLLLFFSGWISFWILRMFSESF